MLINRALKRLLLLLCLSAYLQGTALAVDHAREPASPHLVIDANTGEILSYQRPFTRWAPASLTKLMTAYTVFRSIQLQQIAMNSPVRISESAIAQPPSKMGLPIGTILTIENALKIIMVKSANDISVALAESVGGTEEQFVALMNGHARRLGMEDTNFTNPHGLHHARQFTSARDMAVLARQIAAEFPQYASFFDIPAIRVGSRRLRNHNALLRLFDGTNGMKTGYVCASGFNVLVRTKRKERELIAVVFGEKSGFRRNVKAARLLSKGFARKTKAEKTLENFTRPIWMPDTPVDITRKICPYKYAAEGKPNTRPPDAPSPQDFDGIDTQIIVPEGGLPVAKLEWVTPPLPTKRPTVSGNVINVESKPAIASVALKPTDETEEGASENNLPSAREQAALYFMPAKKLRADVPVTLGGGVGINPHGIKHTDGDVYQPPIPVPLKRPTLDLKASTD